MEENCAGEHYTCAADPGSLSTDLPGVPHRPSTGSGVAPGPERLAGEPSRPPRRSRFDPAHRSRAPPGDHTVVRVARGLEAVQARLHRAVEVARRRARGPAEALPLRPARPGCAGGAQSEAHPAARVETRDAGPDPRDRGAGASGEGSGRAV